MGEKEDKEKAEKLAAAKKRVAQLQKKKKAAASGGGAGEGSKPGAVKSKTKSKKEDKDRDDGVVADGEAGEADEMTEPSKEPDVQSKQELDLDEDTDDAAFNEVLKAANQSQEQNEEGEDDDEAVEHPADDDDKVKSVAQSPETDVKASSSSQGHTARQPSISLQSQIRSTSFRQANRPMSPNEEADDSLYRKQTLRIEELERENKRLEDVEARYHKTEEELEELREKTAERTSSSVTASNEEISKLREEIATLRRNSRKSISSGSGGGGGGGDRQRQPSSSDDSSEALRRELEAKDSTISDLQLEITRLRGEVSKQNEGWSSHDEQVSALQVSLDRAEASIRKLQAELDDSKKSLSRASEKAVVQGTHKTSQETKIKTLERENTDLQSGAAELEKKVDSLEKKVEAMNKLHRETEQRTAQKLSMAESQAREIAPLRAKTESLEKENTRLREQHKRKISTDGDNEALDELEDEEREKLSRRIRELEGEVFELRRGVWREKRTSMQPRLAGNDGEDGDQFDDVDLSASTPGYLSRRRSTASPTQMAAGGGFGRQHSNFTQVLSSGFAAFSSTTPSVTNNTSNRRDSLQEFLDDDLPFDEEAFARSQREEEMKKMVEHVREVKRGLKKWVGYRLDLVDLRRAGGGWGAGEVFEV